MTMEQLVGPLVAAILGGLIGGGAIAGLFYRALKDRLREDLAEAFAGRSEVANMDERITAFTTAAIMARDTADKNSDRITRLEEAMLADRTSLNRTLTRMDRTLDKIEERAQAQQTEIARTVAVLNALEKRMDRHTEAR